MIVRISIGPGELFDRLTILDLKRDRITEPAKAAHVRAQLAELHRARRANARLHAPPGPEAAACIEELRRINASLWDIEAQLRAHEARGQFGAEFVALARAVYRLNDARAATKARLDALFDCPPRDIKDYSSGAARGDAPGMASRASPDPC